MVLHHAPAVVKGYDPAPWELATTTPANVDAERALLGALILSNTAAEYVPDLRPDHFYWDFHARIFEAISDALMAGRSISATTLAPKFRDTILDARTNGAQYLGTLVSQATTIRNVREYAQTIIEMAQRRALIVVGEDIVARASDPTETTPPGQLIAEAEGALVKVSTQGRSGREVSLADAARAALMAAAEAHKRDGRLDGIATKFADLDDKIGGFGNGNLIILGGRPSMGKTALATGIAINVATGSVRIDEDTGEVISGSPDHVHFFSQEMTAAELAMRQIGEKASVPSDRLRRGKFTENEFRAARRAVDHLSLMSMTIDETGGLTIGALAAKARREKRRRNTKLIVIDYLQLMQGSGASRGNRVQDVTEITVGLKALAKELNIPILALSQLNRGLEKMEDKRPQLSDLRESGSIEQDADVVMFVYREEYYWLRKNPPPDAQNDFALKAWQTDFVKVAGKAEVIIGKQRHGDVGIVPMHFDGALTRFSCIAREGGGHG